MPDAEKPSGSMRQAQVGATPVLCSATRCFLLHTAQFSENQWDALLDRVAAHSNERQVFPFKSGAELMVRM